VTYTWDRRKAAANFRKHRVSFEEAATVFLDPAAWTFYDPAHSESEDRFITVGLSRHQRLLFVSHADQDPETVRIISARKATAREEEDYAKIR
jgi:uncharacterized DUF497 family protein